MEIVHNNSQATKFWDEKKTFSKLYGALVLDGYFANLSITVVQKNVHRKVQTVPQSRATANLRHQEEEKKTVINASKIIKQIYEKHIDQLSLP